MSRRWRARDATPNSGCRLTRRYGRPRRNAEPGERSSVIAREILNVAAEVLRRPATRHPVRTRPSPLRPRSADAPGYCDSQADPIRRLPQRDQLPARELPAHDTITAVVSVAPAAEKIVEAVVLLQDDDDCGIGLTGGAAGRARLRGSRRQRLSEKRGRTAVPGPSADRAPRAMFRAAGLLAGELRASLKLFNPVRVAGSAVVASAPDPRGVADSTPR